MNQNAMLTGKPSIDRPWMKFYPDVLRGIQVPACTVEQYLSVRAADPNVIAMHYYGVDITWATVFRKVDATARALQVLGVKQGGPDPRVPAFCAGNSFICCWQPSASALRCCAVTTPWKKTLKLFRKPMPR